MKSEWADPDLDPFSLPAVPFEERHVLPKLAAVYLVLGGNSEVLYVGRSVDLHRRWQGQTHQLAEELADQERVRIAYLAVDHADWLPEVEYALMLRFDPPLNRRGPDASPEQIAARRQRFEARQKKSEGKRQTRALFQVGRVLASYGIDTPRQADELMRRLVAAENEHCRESLLEEVGARRTDRWPEA